MTYDFISDVVVTLIYVENKVVSSVYKIKALIYWHSSFVMNRVGWLVSQIVFV